MSKDTAQEPGRSNSFIPWGSSLQKKLENQHPEKKKTSGKKEEHDSGRVLHEETGQGKGIVQKKSSGRLQKRRKMTGGNRSKETFGESKRLPHILGR